MHECHNDTNMNVKRNTYMNILHVDVFWSHFEVDQLTELVMSCTNTNIYYNEDAQILQAQKCKYENSQI